MLRLQLGRKGEEIADSVGAPFLPSVPVFFFLSLSIGKRSPVV
jgi:hypothetical protein